MRTLAALGLTAVTLSACTSDRPIASSSAPVAAIVVAGSCDIARTRADAGSYAASSSDAIFAIITQLESLLGHGSSAAATDKAFDGLARLAAIRGSSAQAGGSTAAQGAAVALDFLGCMEPAAIGTLPSAASLTSALGAGGLFAVRGGAADPSGGPVFSTSSPAWGAQPQSASSWGASAGGRFLLYGAPLAVTPSPAGDVKDVLAAPTGFDFHTAPAHVTFAPQLVVGACIPVGGAVRIQHVVTVLPLEELDCTVPLTTASAAAPTGLVARLASLFTPAPLYAAMMLPGGVGGLASSFSPYAAIDAKVTTLGVASQPRDGYVNTPIRGTGASGFYEVRVTTAGGTPLAGVRVSLDAVLNNGAKVVASGTVAYSGTDGRAIFPDLQVNKAGGYTLVATGDFDEIGAGTITSARFNIKNKSAP